MQNRYNKNAILVLCGNIYKHKNNTWKTVTHVSNKNFKATGDYWRIKATAIMYKKHPEYIIIASGGKGHLRNTTITPTGSEITKKELINEGVPASSIRQEKKSNNTFKQLKNINKNPFRSLCYKIIISNKWHIPRIKTFLQYIQKKDPIYPNVKVISAENILIKNNPKIEKIIKNAYKNKDIKEQIKKEKQGIKDFNSKKYKFT